MNRYQQLEEKIKELEKRIQYYQENESLQHFIEEFKKNLLVLANTNPFNSWPKWYKEAFKYAQKEAPTAAQIYKMRLPK